MRFFHPAMRSQGNAQNDDCDVTRQPRGTYTPIRRASLGWPLAMLLALGAALLLFGDRVDVWVENRLGPSPSPQVMAFAVFSVLAADIFLPVPSSAVATLAGKQLGPLLATLAAWLGLTFGALVGFMLTKQLGMLLAKRLSSLGDLRDAATWSGESGSISVALLRPAPLLAEASVLAAGLVNMPWRAFLPALALGNLAATLPYTVFGSLIPTNAWLPWAMTAAAVAPLLLTFLLRKKLERSMKEAGSQV